MPVFIWIWKQKLERDVFLVFFLVCSSVYVYVCACRRLSSGINSEIPSFDC